MALKDSQSVFKLIEDGIKAQLIPSIRKELIEILMKEQRERIEKLVDEKLIDISIAHVESFRDALKWRDEIHLHINGVEINAQTKK